MVSFHPPSIYMSPGLFALAIEPLALLIRFSDATWGMAVGPLTEKLSLYADDAFLYLPDTSASLEAALRVINLYGSFSGVRINWAKLILFPLSHSLTPPSHQLTYL